MEITFEGVIDGYIATGLRPGSGGYICVKSGGVEGCGLAAFLSGNLELIFNGQQTLPHTSVPCFASVAIIVFGRRRRDLFTLGFDGHPLNTPHANEMFDDLTADDIRVYEIACRLRRLLVLQGMTPQEVKDRYCLDPVKELV